MKVGGKRGASGAGDGKKGSKESLRIGSLYESYHGKAELVRRVFDFA